MVSSCIFNADAQSFTQEKAEIREMARKLLDFTGFFSFAQFFLISMFPVLQKVIKMRFTNKTAESFFVNLMSQAVKLRESSNIKRDDYLSYLMELKQKKSISDIELAAHGVTFFTDGFETSSIAIAHILYEVSSARIIGRCRFYQHFSCHDTPNNL